jgi:hypothetical protein
LPVALGGRDIIGIASTGSGKTAAFALPLLRHVAGQAILGKGDGPVGLIVAPTHELAEQIVREVRRLGKPGGVRVAGLIGGVGKFEQMKELRAGVEVRRCLFLFGCAFSYSSKRGERGRRGGGKERRGEGRGEGEEGEKRGRGKRMPLGGKGKGKEGRGGKKQLQVI